MNDEELIRKATEAACRKAKPGSPWDEWRATPNAIAEAVGAALEVVLEHRDLKPKQAWSWTRERPTTQGVYRVRGNVVIYGVSVFPIEEQFLAFRERTSPHHVAEVDGLITRILGDVIYARDIEAEWCGPLRAREDGTWEVAP